MGVLGRALDRLGSLAEVRSTLSAPADWLIEAFTGPRTSTGRHVSAEGALKLVPVYACVNLLAGTIASLPLPLYRRLSPRGKARAPEHPLYRLLHDRPNPEMTSFEFREVMAGHVETWGNAYAEVEWAGSGRPLALWPLRPDRMAVERDGTQERRIRYAYTVPSGQQFALRADQVLHWRGLSPDGLVGYSPIGLLREAVGLGFGLEEYAGRFFGNDSRPGGVLQTDGVLSDDSRVRLKAGWEAAHRGLGNAHRVAVLEEGVKWQTVGIPPQDAQFVEARKFQRGEIAMVYGVPPHMIGDVEKTTSWGTGIEEQSIGFAVYSLRRRLVRYEQATNQRLLSEAEQETYFAEFLVDGLLRGDWKSRSDALHVMRGDGVINADEWRELENMNPQEGGQGQTYWMPVNMVPADKAGALVDAKLAAPAAPATNGAAQ